MAFEILLENKNEREIQALRIVRSHFDKSERVSHVRHSIVFIPSVLRAELRLQLSVQTHICDRMIPPKVIWIHDQFLIISSVGRSTNRI